VNPSSSVASALQPLDRQDLALKILAKNEKISHLAHQEGVSRKFLYQQKGIAQVALNTAFNKPGKDNEVLYYLPVTQKWIFQLILAFLFEWLLPELFQSNRPVLTGVDAHSTYCFILESVEHRDEDTWGWYLLEAEAQGLNPDYTIADAGKGIRAGQKAAWGDKPCHGDVWHI
jgi:hypothetical protein